MSLSDDLCKVKEKYKPKHMKIEYTPCSSCKNTFALKMCLECEMCGRKFEDGVLVKEAYPVE